MALPITVPYTFGTATTAIPLTNLDSDFSTVYYAVNGLGNGTVALANVQITGVGTTFPNNFLANSSVTIGNTAVALGSTASSVGNVTLANVTVTNYIETAPAITNSSTAVTLSLTSGTVLSYTLTGNCTFTMPTATSGTSFILKLIQDGTGSRTATFTGVKWPGGTAPTITTTASTGLDILSFVCINSVWYGTYAQAFA